MKSKGLSSIKSTKFFEFRNFMSAVIDIATKPQIFKQWIKERKAWRNMANANENVKVSDAYTIRLKRGGEKEFTTIRDGK